MPDSHICFACSEHSLGAETLNIQAYCENGGAVGDDVKNTNRAQKLQIKISICSFLREKNILHTIWCRLLMLQSSHLAYQCNQCLLHFGIRSGGRVETRPIDLILSELQHNFKADL